MLDIGREVAVVGVAVGPGDDMLLDEFFETLDANTIVPGKTDYSYDIIR